MGFGAIIAGNRVTESVGERQKCRKTFRSFVKGSQNKLNGERNRWSTEDFQSGESLLCDTTMVHICRNT